VVNSVLLGSGCTDCKVVRDDTFGLFARYHTPCSSEFLPSQSMDTQGTASLIGQCLENGRQGTPSASQFFTMGKVCPSSPRLGPRRELINPLSRRHTPSISPLRDLPSFERALYKGMKLDNSGNSMFSPPAGLFRGNGRKAFTQKASPVEDISSAPPNV